MLLNLKSRLFRMAFPVLMTIVVMSLLVGFSTPAMAADSAKYPGSGASVAGFNKSWSNPGRITADDGSYASAEMNNLSNKTNYLRAYDFSFEIPAGATISGIQVEIGRYGSHASSIKDEVVQLVYSSLVLGLGDDNADKTNYWPSTEAAKTYGGPSDTWGIAEWMLTPTLINDSNFGVVLAANKSGSSNRTAYVDYIRMTVTYNDDVTAPDGSIIINGGAESCASASVTLHLEATDAVGVTGYRAYNGLLPSGDVVNITPTASYSEDVAWTLSEGPGLKMVSVKYCDAAGNWSDAFTDSIMLAPADTTAPTGSLSINLGLPTTTSPDVTINLWATDLVGVTGYRVDNGGDASGAPTNDIESTLVYLENVPWSLPPGPGEKTVAVQYCDAAGNWSANYTDSIELTAPLDIVPPSGSVTINGGADSCSGQDVTLHLEATDAVGVTGYRIYNGLVPSGDVVDIAPTTGFSQDIAWTLTEGSGLKTVSVQYFDAAGNGSIPCFDTILMDNAPVAVDDSYTMNEGSTLLVEAPGVMHNDSDADGDVIFSTLVAGPSHGLLLLNVNGSFSYTPDSGYSGEDSFTYRITDSWLNSAVAVVTLNINPAGSQCWLLFNINHELDSGLYLMQQHGDPEGSVVLDYNNYWLADSPAEGDVTFSAGTWKVHLAVDRTIGVKVTIGCWIPGEGFQAFGGPDSQWLDSEGYAYFDMGSLTVAGGNYMALKISCKDYIVTTEGDSYLCIPANGPTNPVPEASSLMLMGTGLLCLAAFVVYRTRQPARRD